MTDLPTILTRLEEATGADRELDFAIWDFFYPPEPKRVIEGVKLPEGFGKDAINYAMDPRPELTGSIDAAVGLVERRQVFGLVCPLHSCRANPI